MNVARRIVKPGALWFAVALGVASASAGNLPVDKGEARTPETRTLAAAASSAARVRVSGEPLLDRAEKEIGWARALADRLARLPRAPDLSAQLGELESLEQHLAELRNKPPAVPPARGTEAVPSWIWYPEGDPVQDAPAEARCFRCRFTLPAKARAAELRIAADDACEVYLNGKRVGSNETWQRAAVFSVGGMLHAGVNLLAVRAENRPAPSKNPAGLLARLAVTLADGKQVTVVSDGTWRVENRAHPKWEQAALDDSAWKPAAVAAPFGGGPWGKIAGLVGPDLEEDPAAAYAHAPPAVMDFYFSVRRVKHAITMKNPVLDFTALLFVDQPLPQGPNSRHEAIHRMGIMAVPGGRLLVLDGLHPGGRLRQLAPEKPGSF